MSQVNIEAAQVRAARALLNWSQDDLAMASDLSKEAIVTLEKGVVSPKTATVASVRLALDEAGIELIDNSGVRRRPEGIDMLSGTSGFCKFLDLVYEHLRDHGGRVCVSGVDEKQWIEHLGSYAQTIIDRMTRLTKERGDIEFRSLVRQGTAEVACSAYSDYRWVPKEYFNAVPFYAYGHNLAMINFLSDTPPKIWIHHSSSLTKAWRDQFMSQWESAHELPKRLVHS